MQPVDAPCWPPRVPEYHLVRPIIGAAPIGRREPDATKASDARTGPQAYVVENGSARRTLRVHFHVVDQFQFVVDGAATIGRSDVSPGVVHYADRYTPYGPLRYGSRGLAYLTLRAATDTAASYMPDAADELTATLERDERDAATRRNITRDLNVAASAADGSWVDVVADDDGLRIGVVELPGGGTAVRTTIAGSGAFTVVLAGSVADDGAGVGHHLGALAWCPPAAEPVITAGTEGARVALLQLPGAPTIGGTNG